MIFSFDWPKTSTDQNEALFTFEGAHPSAQTVHENAALLGTSRPHR